MSEPTSSVAEAGPRWRPLPAIDRRVLGVLVEKAKTTPDGYPMSLNALRAGCNQKSNRFPMMTVEPEDIEESLARLREVGAAAEVQGGGRIPRYRHYFYEWLGVEKVEAAVMTELLLRGAQTEGELRGRAARMEPIADVAALRPVLASLKQKGLILSLTPEGRGHVVTHALFEPRELEKQKAEAAHGHFSAAPEDEGQSDSAAPIAQARSSPAPSYAAPAPSRATAPDDAVAELKDEVAQLRSEVDRLRKEVEDIWSSLR